MRSADVFSASRITGVRDRIGPGCLAMISSGCRSTPANRSAEAQYRRQSSSALTYESVGLHIRNFGRHKFSATASTPADLSANEVGQLTYFSIPTRVTASQASNRLGGSGLTNWTHRVANEFGLPTYC